MVKFGLSTMRGGPQKRAAPQAVACVHATTPAKLVLVSGEDRTKAYLLGFGKWWARGLSGGRWK